MYRKSPHCEGFFYVLFPNILLMDLARNMVLCISAATFLSPGEPLLIAVHSTANRTRLSPPSRHDFEK